MRYKSSSILTHDQLSEYWIMLYYTLYNIFPRNKNSLDELFKSKWNHLTKILRVFRYKNFSRPIHFVIFEDLYCPFYTINLFYTKYYYMLFIDFLLISIIIILKIISVSSVYCSLHWRKNNIHRCVLLKMQCSLFGCFRA